MQIHVVELNQRPLLSVTVGWQFVANEFAAVKVVVKSRLRKFLGALLRVLIPNDGGRVIDEFPNQEKLDAFGFGRLRGANQSDAPHFWIRALPQEEPNHRKQIEADAPLQIRIAAEFNVRFNPAIDFQS